ncbi:glycosyltransferase [Neotabrizicola sp. VNH66]|uniref:glycosyltransferase n=1 Tax=Neotabrizicola sp. VNH66 TaxID=3400918 RepID=UPI003C0BDC0D
MTAALIAGLALLAGLHFATALLALWRPRPAAPAAGTPGITLLRPVRGLDSFDLETLESSFRLTWPDYEVIFCAADAADPACAAVRAMIARHPQVRAQLMIGDERISGNPKLNNLHKGWVAARGQMVAMADANLLLPPDYLQRLMAAWRPGCALVSSPAAGTRPGNLWGAVECAFLNGFQGRWQLAADRLGNGFAQGKTLFVEKAWLDAAGGLAPLGRKLAEDVAFTLLVRSRGARVCLTARMFEQPVGRRPFRAVWDRQLRWSRVRRDGFPLLFAAEILAGPLPPALILGGLAPGWLIPGVLAWYAAEWALARRMGWPAGPRDLLAMVLRDLALPALWAATWARRGFEWRGNAMGAPAMEPGDVHA